MDAEDGMDSWVSKHVAEGKRRVMCGESRSTKPLLALLPERIRVWKETGGSASLHAPATFVSPLRGSGRAALRRFALSIPDFERQTRLLLRPETITKQQNRDGTIKSMWTARML